MSDEIDMQSKGVGILEATYYFRHFNNDDDEDDDDNGDNDNDTNNNKYILFDIAPHP